MCACGRCWIASSDRLQICRRHLDLTAARVTRRMVSAQQVSRRPAAMGYVVACRLSVLTEWMYVVCCSCVVVNWFVTTHERGMVMCSVTSVWVSVCNESLDLRSSFSVCRYIFRIFRPGSCVRSLGQGKGHTSNKKCECLSCSGYNFWKPWPRKFILYAGMSSEYILGKVHISR